MNTMTMGSLFDGIGGFPLAAVRLGIQPVWASEIDAFPIEVTRCRFPSMAHQGDITKLKGDLLFPVDLICGGSPCQDSVWPERGPDWPVSVPAFLWSRCASSRRCAPLNGSAGTAGPVSGPAFWCGRMFPASLAAARQRGRIFASYWRKSCESSAAARLSPAHFPTLGRMPATSPVRNTPSLWPGAASTRNSGVSRSGEGVFFLWRILLDSLRRIFYSTPADIPNIQEMDRHGIL